MRRQNAQSVAPIDLSFQVTFRALSKDLSNDIRFERNIGPKKWNQNSSDTY